MSNRANWGPRHGSQAGATVPAMISLLVHAVLGVLTTAAVLRANRHLFTSFGVSMAAYLAVVERQVRFDAARPAAPDGLTAAPASSVAR